jgi:hypothetical protein
MKKIQREVKTYENIYVSVDGKEFKNEPDCVAWENSYKGTLEASWQLINKKEVCDCDYGIPWASEDHECYVIKPKNLDEIVLINAYINATTCYDGILTANHIGTLLMLNFGYDHDYCEIYDLTEHIAKVQENITKLNAEFNGEKEETECTAQSERYKGVTKQC